MKRSDFSAISGVNRKVGPIFVVEARQAIIETQAGA